MISAIIIQTGMSTMQRICSIEDMATASLSHPHSLTLQMLLDSKPKLFPPADALIIKETELT